MYHSEQDLEKEKNINDGWNNDFCAAVVVSDKRAKEDNKKCPPPLTHPRREHTG
jgi:hypothetical protein